MGVGSQANPKGKGKGKSSGSIWPQGVKTDASFIKTSPIGWQGNNKPWVEGSLKPAMGFDEATQEELTDFIAIHPELDQEATQKFMELHPKLQTVVLGKGPMHDAKNQSACLLQRCRLASTMKNDDWICL